MKQEEKDLLLKDLCGRLTYGVKVIFGDSKPALLTVIEHDEFGWQIGSEDEFGGMITIIDNVKPYLFPISSMTEEQKKEYRKVCDLDMEILENRPMKGEPFPAMFNSQDWLDAHHFDYRGLIPMGLANDVTGLNIY